MLEEALPSLARTGNDDESEIENQRMAVLIVAVLGAALSLAAVAFAADQTDRSFGQEGVVEIVLPSKASGFDAGIRDLASVQVACRGYAGIYGDMQGVGHSWREVPEICAGPLEMTDAIPMSQKDIAMLYLCLTLRLPTRSP